MCFLFEFAHSNWEPRCSSSPRQGIPLGGRLPAPYPKINTISVTSWEIGDDRRWFNDRIWLQLNEDSNLGIFAKSYFPSALTWLKLVSSACAEYETSESPCFYFNVFRMKGIFNFSNKVPLIISTPKVYLYGHQWLHLDVANSMLAAVQTALLAAVSQRPV